MATSGPEATMSRPPSGIVSPRPMRSRTQSISSDRPSTIGLGLMSPPQSVSPEPAFIAASAASQIVTNDHDTHADIWYYENGIEPSGEATLVSEGALQLVNSFLDQLLFNFLQVSRATTLAALRPAVSEVLKPKLAKDAINNADEELREYLGGADEDEYAHPSVPNTPGSPRDWDLELAWKRTRLRCMVYSSLGDMEEEDEDLHMEQENLEVGADEHASATISPAVAIFLTSVLEYMGELTLTVAGQAAYQRMRVRHEKEVKEGLRSPSDIADQIILEDADMERVALDRTLGRLWRGWKKRIRSPTIDFGGISRSIGHMRHDSAVIESPGLESAAMDSSHELGRSQEQVTATIAEVVLPADIPLPLGSNDLAEIEVPGLAIYSDDEQEEDEEEDEPRKRPRSMYYPLVLADGRAAPLLVPVKRSNSVPNRRASRYPKEEPAKGTDADSKMEGDKVDMEQPGEKVVVEKDATEQEKKEKENDQLAEKNVEPARTIEQVDVAARRSMIADRRRSKMLAVTSQALEAAAPTHRGTSAGVDDDAEVATYEKAEIMTSARVSVCGSSSTSLSDSARPMGIKRSSSVHSARIIEVGPRSPTGSRDPSADPNERARPVSLSRASSYSGPSLPEDSRKPRALEPVPRSAVGMPASRSPIDRMRPSMQNAHTISESEEEEDNMSVPAVDVSNYTGPQTAWGMGRNGSYSSFSAEPTYPYQTQAQPEESVPVPEIPRKAPGHAHRHAYSRDSEVSVERVRTRDSDEETALPLQSNATPRKAYTSASTSASTSSPMSGRIKAVRTSEDRGPSRAEDVARNFEELIQSNQTITYTLTPENMRDMDAKRSLDSPVMTKPGRKSEDSWTHNRSRSSSAANDSRRIPASPISGLGMHPVSEESVSSPVHSPTSVGTSSPVNRMAGYHARDARATGDSTSDFSAFLKHTGPPGDSRPQPLRTPNGSSSPAMGGAELRRSSTTTSNRSRYQPREAAVDTRGDSSDLIDFIRNGPPGPANNPRIPRHVAPFRTTMDSEQLAVVTGGRPIEPTIPEVRNSQASTSITDASMPSIHSSINSTSALLKSKPSATSNKMFDDDDMMPKRKTRRVRDPYAIDISDDELDDDEFLAGPKPPAKKEESLAEFLRNYNPPPEPELPPAKIPKKKASAPSLIGRFTRSSSSSHNNQSSNTESRSLSSRMGSKGHIPLQVSMPPGYDKYGPITDSAPRNTPPPTGSSGRVPMKKYEPREAVSVTTRTSDLASFLRDSGPVEDDLAVRMRPEEPNGFAKVFGRRKKTPLY
ncbi:hypothetical protein B0I35DRAFT_129732 [Stachybotrys elegans]|uniref:Flo11 n=1 Tax=Stachybotrys elegans TaxID=80388 RepID=A0A8K0T513_9HYPO|nr:hypothetical protein B0I35DRAFT_129732 [Stachybotrys elegans]